MKKMKKLLALLIVISIVSTSMGTAVFASSDLPAEIQSDQKTESEDNLQNNANIDVEGTDSVGDILALAISEENEKSEERQKSVNSITGLDFSENNASVEYQTEEDAEIVVAVYDEQHSRMLASGNTDASKDGTVASVTITGDMPQYFVATAFLLDKESHEALCDSFTTEMYTKDIQDLKNSTTDNYDQDKVVQLEEGNKDTNFAVFNDETKVVTEDSEKNQIKDNGDGTYTITNMDDTLSDLKAGDTIACSYSDGTFLLIKAGSIQSDGTTIIVTEDTDAGLTDYFDYVKIEADSSQGEMEIDNSLLEDGVTPTSDVQEAGYSSHEASISRSVSYNASKEFESGVKLTGNFTYGFMFTVDVYVTSQYQYLSIKNEVNAGISVDISGKLAQKEIPLGRIEVQPVPCINVGFTPSFVVEASAKIEWSGEISACIGGAYDGNTGFKNLSTWPSCDSSLKMEGKLFIGIKATPYVSFISDKLAKASLSFTGGTEIIATNNIYGAADGKLHECTLCLGGKVYANLALELETDFLKDKVKKTKSYNLAKIKISDFYYSTDHDEFGWTTCPYISYPVKVSAKDKDGNNITGTTTITVTGKESGKAVKIKDKTSKILDSVTLTDSEEKTVYLPNGAYVVHAVNGDQQGEADLTVTGGETEVKLNLEAIIASGVDGNITWKLMGNGTLYIDGKGDMPDYRDVGPWYASYVNVHKILKVIIGKGVTSIGGYAFRECSRLKSIEIPDSVTSIGWHAFNSCSSLSRIEVPDGVTSIGMGAFNSCSSLRSIEIPDSITSIEDSVFSGCSSLNSIKIPDSVTSIEFAAFSGCSSLSRIEIPDSVTRIGSVAFSGCSSLSRIEIPNSVTSIEYETFQFCNSLSSIEIPDSVTSIGMCAFRACSSLKNIEIPDRVTSIGEWAFRECSSLESIEIPNGVTSIGEYTFSGCSSLRSIEIPDSVTDIGRRTFEGCSSLKSIEIPESVTSIAYGIFLDCSSLSRIEIPDSVTGIGWYAFSGCSGLESIEIPNSVTGIGEWAFSGCSSLRSIEIPDSVTRIGMSAFSGCSSLSRIEIGNSVTRIESYTFSGCSNLRSIEIPDSVTRIESYAFSDCSSLSRIEIGNSVTRIESSTFSCCSNLSGIYFKGNKPDPDYDFLYGLSNVTIYYPQNDTTWSDIESDSYGGTNIKWVAYDPSMPATASVGVESTGNAVSAEDLFDESGVTSESQNGIPDFSDDVSDSEAEISEADITIESENDSDSLTETPPASNDDAVSVDETAEDDFNSDDMVVTELTPAVSNAQADATSGSSYMFSNLVPLGRYLFVVVKDENAEDFLAESNLLYISQKNADEEGTVLFRYILRENCESPVARVFGAQLKDISGAEVTLSETAYTYDGTVRTPAVTVKMDGDILKNDVDYTVEYANNVKPGTATATVVGKGSYTGSVSVSFTIKPQSAKSDNTIKASDITKNVSKKAQTVNIKASTLGGAKLTYSSDNKSVKVNAGGKITIVKNFTGKAVITITAAETAKYKRISAKITVTVRPIGTSLTKLTNNAKGKLKIRWKRNKSVTGYMIQYSTDKNFRKSVKTVNIRKNKKTSTTLAKLKKGKTYYVRIATYKKSGGKICSSWSKVKKIRIKK